MPSKKRQRVRPAKYLPDFQRDAVAMVFDGGRSIADVGRSGQLGGECRSPGAWDHREVSFARSMGPPCRQSGTTRGSPVAVLLSVQSPSFDEQLRRAAMAFREVRVYEVREVLRLWLRGEGVVLG